MVLRSSDLTPITDVDGNSDYSKIVDDSESNPLLKDKTVVAKHSTGGMIAHGNAVKAFYRFNYANTGVASYRKIATLPIQTTSAGHLKLLVHIGWASGSGCASLEIILGNKGGLYERVRQISGAALTNLTEAGIRTYVETDTSLSVYVFDDGTNWQGVTVELVSFGYGVLPVVMPPNKVVSIPIPAGTLSLDTTAGKYVNGVPDGNENWITPTLLNSWVRYDVGYYTAEYMRESSGVVYLRGDIKLGSVGLSSFVLPVGYRPALTQRFIVKMGLSTHGEVIVYTDGNVVFYQGTNEKCSLSGVSFKAEQ